MASRAGLPSIKCVAKNRNGDPCGLWAKPGTTVCYLHGSKAPQTNGKAEIRVTLSQLMQSDPRPPWVVLLEATHFADALMRDAQARLGDDVTPDELDRFVQALGRAAALAKTTLDAKVGDILVRNMELNGHIIVTVLARALDRMGSELTLDQRTRLHGLIHEELLRVGEADLPEDRPALEPPVRDPRRRPSRYDPEG